MRKCLKISHGTIHCHFLWRYDVYFDQVVRRKNVSAHSSVASVSPFEFHALNFKLFSHSYFETILAYNVWNLWRPRARTFGDDDSWCLIGQRMLSATSKPRGRYNYYQSSQRGKQTDHASYREHTQTLTAEDITESMAATLLGVSLHFDATFVFLWIFFILTLIFWQKQILKRVCPFAYSVNIYFISFISFKCHCL